MVPPLTSAAPFERLGRCRPLLVEDNTLFASRGIDLFRSQDYGLSFERVASLPGSLRARFLARCSLSSRILRHGLRGLCRTPDGGMVAVARGAILYCAPGADEFRIAHTDMRGRRPLNVVADRHGVFFGEYYFNHRRDSVHVFGSADGRSFEPVYTFAPGVVRHVHGIFPDPYRGGLWVLTGDDDEECGLWFTDDGFRTLERVVGGNQSFRAVCIHPEPDGLVVPMDTPFERNRIQWLDLSNNSLMDVLEVEGSVFYSGRTRDVRLLSTVVEPSKVNRSGSVHVYASRDGRRWAEVTRLRRDLLSRIDVKEITLVTYPQVIFPAGRCDQYAFGGAISVRGLEGRLLRWNQDDLLAALEGAGV